MYQPNDKYNSDHNNFQKGEKKKKNGWRLGVKSGSLGFK